MSLLRSWPRFAWRFYKDGAPDGAHPYRAIPPPWLPSFPSVKEFCLRSLRLLVGSLFDFRHDLQAEVQHGAGIADKIATAGKNEVQVIIQFQTATDIERKVRPAIGDGCSIAEKLNAEAQSVVDFAL